jgi:hypothetical protein
MMEGLGYISTAEAFIAARHRSAWNAALRLAKTKGIYTGVDIEPLTIVNQLQRPLWTSSSVSGAKTRLRRSSKTVVPCVLSSFRSHVDAV